jgi:hypothetical protein
VPIVPVQQVSRTRPGTNGNACLTYFQNIGDQLTQSETLVIARNPRTAGHAPRVRRVPKTVQHRAPHGVRLAAIGLGIGVAGALAITRLMTTMLYGVRPTDPLVFGSVAVALMAVAASVVPSLRIARIRPANALRYE